MFRKDRWKSIVAGIGMGCFLALGTAACGEADGPLAGADAAESNAGEAAADMFESLHDKAQTISYYVTAEHLAEYLPGQRFSFDGGEPVPATDGIIRGVSIYAAVRNYPIEEGEDERPDAEPVAPDAPDADARALAVTVDVTEAWGVVEDRLQVSFIVLLGGHEDPQESIDALTQLDDVIVVLGSRFRDVADGHETDVYRTAIEFLTLGVVDSDEQISFPAMDPAEEADFLRDITSIRDVREQAHIEKPVIEYEGATRVNR